jgi:hypothetical protein
MRRTALQRAVDDALLTTCRGGHPRLAEEAVTAGPALADDLVAGARYHRVAPLAHVALRRHHPELAELLADDRSRALIHHLRASERLAAVARVLSGLRWLAFKGPILSEFAHPVPGLRFYKDLDVLVAPGEFREACTRLLAEGWQVLLSAESLGSAELPGELALADPHGLVLDLHWATVVSRTARRRFTGDAEALLGRRRQVTIGPAQAWAFSRGDALVHVAQHAALIGATKLGHLLDADQLARQVDDWDDLVERAGEWGAGVEVAAVLGRAGRLFGTPIPDGLAERLGVGAGMRRLLREIDRRWPVQTLREDASPVRLLTRALRPGLAATTGNALQRASRGVWHRLREPRGRAGTPAGAEALDAYLERVELARAD